MVSEEDLPDLPPGGGLYAKNQHMIEIFESLNVTKAYDNSSTIQVLSNNMSELTNISNFLNDV